jgi:eukaryotic-like serine/threonine-protein kinase
MSRSLSAEVLASRYRLDALIASGGMGAVWRAVDLVLDRPVAVKLLRDELAQHPDTIARFRAEARHAAGISHPSIAQVYDFGEADADQPAFLVLELVDGPPLTDLIGTGPLPPDQVMDIVAQVASGLAVAHAGGVVHRDIKPGNLLLDSSGVVKITDFGVAYAAGSAPLTRTGTLIGTPAYLAPERIAGEAAGPASDLYSLGMVAYECLAGAMPFTGTAMEIALAHRTQWLPPLPASVPAQVAGLVGDLTAKDPGGRPAAAAEVAARARALRDDIRAGAIGTGGSRSFLAGAGAAGLAGSGLAGSGPAGSGSPDVTAELPAAADWQLAEPGGSGPALPTGGYVPPAAAGYGASSLRTRQRGRPRASRGRIAVMAAAFAVTACLAGWLVASLAGAASPHVQPPRSHASSHAGHTVTVNAAALTGQPVLAVVRELRDLGLRVAVTWEPTRDARPGTVIAVRPGGKVLAGTTVHITAARRAHDRGRGHDHGQGHGQGGNGQGGD